MLAGLFFSRVQGALGALTSRALRRSIIFTPGLGGIKININSCAAQELLRESPVPPEKQSCAGRTWYKNFRKFVTSGTGPFTG